MLIGGVSLAAAGAMVGASEGCGGDAGTTIFQGNTNTVNLIQGGNNPGASPGVQPPAFVQPAVLKSAFGVLDTTLTVRFANNTITTAPANINTRTFNGALVGPTLRVRPGDVLRVRVDNQMGLPNPNPKQADENIPHDFNTTNIHTHGLHVSPQGTSDNIFVEIPPTGATTFQYEYLIPANHPAGTLFYHPHKHGSSSIQMLSGMAGALIIEGGIDAVPEVAAARDLVFLIAELNINAAGQVPDWNAGAPNPFAAGQRRFLVNGVEQPVLQAFSGEVIRLRLINASPRTNMNFGIAGHQLNILSFDGLNLATPRVANNVMLPPAGRADVLVRCGAAGNYDIQKLVDTPPFNQPPQPPPLGGLQNLGRLTVLPTVVNMALPTNLLPQPHANIPGPVAVQRTITFGNAGVDAGPAGFPDFTVASSGGNNGNIGLVHFDATQAAEIITPVLGTTEEWLILNASGQTHPFHIHVNPFEVVEVNGVALPVTEWHDTFNISAGGSIRIRHRFEDFTGMFVFHCHILLHEDLGMMRVVNVI